MKKVVLLILLILIMVAGACAGYAQTRRGTARPADAKTIRGAAAGLLGWRFVIPASAFRQATFSEAAGKVDGLGVGLIQGSSPQLDYTLPPEELAKVKSRLGELRLRMLSYRADKIGADRKLFEFAKRDRKSTRLNSSH